MRNIANNKHSNLCCVRKILIISHSSVVDVYQDKVRELSKCKDFQVSLLIPDVYFEASKLVYAKQDRDDYRVEKLHAVFGKSGRQNLHFYPSLYWALKRLRPDIIHLEEEPESLVSFQAIYFSKLLKPNPKILLFSWRNLDKTHREWGLQRPQRYLYPLIEKYTLRNLDYLIAGNQEGSDIFQRKGYRWPIKVIPQYGVNADRFKKIENAVSSISILVVAICGIG